MLLAYLKRQNKLLLLLVGAVCIFAAVFALKTAGSPLWKPALAVALVIAFSRLYLYVHWPSDVLGGALLGAAVGWAGAKIVEKSENIIAKRKAGR